MSPKTTTLRILSSLKSIIDDDFSCPICIKPCTDTLISPKCGHRFCRKCIKAEGEGNRNCPTCGVQIATHQSCRADLLFDRILGKVVTELVVPLEMRLVLGENNRGNDKIRPQKDQAADSSTVEVAAQQKLKVCAQNEAIAGAVGSRKRHRSFQEQQFLYTTAATHEEEVYDRGNDSAIVGRRRKTLERSETVSCAAKDPPPRMADLKLQHEFPNQNVTRTTADNSARESHTSRTKRPTTLCKKTGDTEAPSMISNKKNPERLDLFSEEQTETLQEQEQSPSKSSTKSVTGKTDNNPSHAAGSVAKQNAPACFESSGMSLRKNPKIIEVLKGVSALAFQKRIEELGAFKAKFGHCNVTHESTYASNKQSLSLARWSAQVRLSRRLIDEGKSSPLKLYQAQIESLDALGFLWEGPKKNSSLSIEDRLEELRNFKAKFGHCNVTLSTSASNKPYRSLARWCAQVRSTRRLIDEGKPSKRRKLSNAQIESLDALGFRWENPIDERIEELKKFKAKFGHCNISPSAFASNKQYISLGRWCAQVRLTRRLIDDGKPSKRRKLSNAQIESLDALGFRWENIPDARIEELRKFKAKFGHCNVTQSAHPSNKQYLSLGRWCGQVRSSRRMMEEGKPCKRGKLTEAQIESLDALGFRWENITDTRIEELRKFKAKFGHCYVTQSKSDSNKPYLSLAGWCMSVRSSRRTMEEGKPSILKLSKAQIESLDVIGFPWGN